ncbi:class I SAM-dependent methyltransferase [Taibaiella soli]|uniref:SAM-dependent methyltransferase n=1 Tax=Taibaiella soli TaxID=1649169 RepID=A0A2W2AL68_9BACT|nr:methyltransferase domain-containing protein [Taibaiella soli]PZF73050.1 SAM-dependent methyltransferase [Taibaiella soli]
MTAITRHPASYRDPSGFVFRHFGDIYRMVNISYKEDYDLLMQSGLYTSLAEKKIMLSHTDVTAQFSLAPNAYKVIQPEAVPFWTYPYEWSFEQLKQAALLTLQLNKLALAQNMILKDATAYNIQFVAGKPILIDSLSFEKYTEGAPWKAFRQFCTHFVYPLLLQSKVEGLNPAIFSQYPDGISAKLTASLLPKSSKYNLNNWLYLYLPAKLEGKQDDSAKQRSISVSKTKILQNMEQLSGFIQKMKPPVVHSNWNHYYSETILSQEYLQFKEQTVAQWLKEKSPKTTVDVGCNTGVFSFIASQNSGQVVSLDTDPYSIDLLFLMAQKEGVKNLTTFVGDICNPAAAFGWNNAEQSALLSRLKGDMVLSLALIHHLALTKNVPLEMILETFANISTQYVIMEFVPKSDPRSQTLLQNKTDIFPSYTQADFETVAQQFFTIEKQTPMQGSERVLYLLKKGHL